jgi:hypothetical protein
MEQTRPFTGKTGTPSSDRQVLARGTKRHDIHGTEVVGADLTDIVMQGSGGEMTAKNGLRLLVDLDGPCRPEALALKTEVEAADTGKQGADGFHSSSSFGTSMRMMAASTKRASGLPRRIS